MTAADLITESPTRNEKCTLRASSNAAKTSTISLCASDKASSKFLLVRVYPEYMLIPTWTGSLLVLQPSVIPVSSNSSNDRKSVANIGGSATHL